MLVQHIVGHRHLRTTAHSGDSVVQFSSSAELQSLGAATCSRLQLYTHDYFEIVTNMTRWDFRNYPSPRTCNLAKWMQISLSVFSVAKPVYMNMLYWTFAGVPSNDNICHWFAVWNQCYSNVICRAFWNHYVLIQAYSPSSTRFPGIWFFRRKSGTAEYISKAKHLSFHYPVALQLASVGFFWDVMRLLSCTGVCRILFFDTGGKEKDSIAWSSLSVGQHRFFGKWL